MRISIIIPVYNAEAFIKQAVESALLQPETVEVILIEDGSTDDSLAVCQSLADKHDKVRLLQHPGGANRGAGASRNLGMQNAVCEYIAFLDADDVYLPGRFTIAKAIFETEPDCEGVYEGCGIKFENDNAKERWEKSPMANIRMTTMTEVVSPDALFERLVLGDAGYFAVHGLLIRRSVINKVGYMDPTLRLHQDTDFILRLSAVACLYPGSLKDPVAQRRVHIENRISAPRSEKDVYQARMKMWWATFFWLDERGLRDKKKVIYTALLNYVAGHKPLACRWMAQIPTVSGQPSFFAQLARIFLLPFDHPIVIFTWGYWKLILSIILSAITRNLRRFFKLFDRTSKKTAQ